MRWVSLKLWRGRIGTIPVYPLAAYAEIAVEAEILPDQGKTEGPFSEWTGYYASGERGPSDFIGEKKGPSRSSGLQPRH